MELLALSVAVIAILVCVSLGKDLKRLEERTARMREEIERSIRQLQDNGLSPADREVLDRLAAAASRTKHYDPHEP